MVAEPSLARWSPLGMTMRCCLRLPQLLLLLLVQLILRRLVVFVVIFRLLGLPLWLCLKK